MSRATLWIVAVVLVSLLSGACAADSLQVSRAPSQSADTDTVRMALLPFLGSAALFIAEEEGYWAEQGIAMEYVNLDSGAQALSAIMQGDLDVSHPAIGAGILNAISRGGQARMVAAGTQWSSDACAYSGLVARKDGISMETLASGEPVSDLRIAVSPIDMSGYYVDALLALGGNSLEDQIVDDLPAPNLGEALGSGSLDLAHASEPWLTRILAGGDMELIAGANEVLPDAQFSVLLFGPTLLEGDADVGQRFLMGYLKAVRQYNEGKTERNVQIIAKHTSLDPEFVRSLCWSSIPLDGQINTSSIVQFQGWAMERSLIDRELTVDEIVDDRFLERANEAIGQ